MPELPERLPDLAAILEPEVLVEVSLPDVVAERGEQVDKCLGTAEEVCQGRNSP